MADIETGGGGHKGGKNERKKSSTKVDFTPMVDLGFLLITFFMLTTSMTKPKTMEIQKPKDAPEKDKNKLKASQALTLILTKENKIVYYLGLLNDPKSGPVKPQVIGFGPDEFRKLLKEENKKRNPDADIIAKDKDLAESGKMSEDNYKAERKKIEEKWRDQALFVLIKMDDRAKYKNMVDALDEMSITNIRSYAIVDIAPQEKEMVSTYVK